MLGGLALVVYFSGVAAVLLAFRFVRVRRPGRRLAERLESTTIAVLWPILLALAVCVVVAALAEKAVEISVDTLRPAKGRAHLSIPPGSATN